MGFRRYHILDTAVASDNVGDEIIMEATTEEMAPVLSEAYVTTASSHDGMGRSGRDFARSADAVFLFGSNALNPKFHVGRGGIWRLGWRDLSALKGRLVLVGVGARYDFDRVGPRQLMVLRHILSPTHLHAVRDEGARRILEAVGVPVLNTSCSTLWRWRDAGPSLPTGPAPAAVFTLTRHKPAAEDREMVRILAARYGRLHFWPQQIDDLDYLAALDTGASCDVIPPNLAAYQRFLAETDVDYVGTRLHGGIQAMRSGRRSVIVQIDNRAREIAADTGLPAIARADIPAGLDARLASAFETKLALPKERIERFIAQFAAQPHTNSSG